jgi:membrane protein DedA with SNARE-associated domain
VDVVERLVDGWPYAAVFALFFASGMARSHLTYWAGRGLRRGGGRTPIARHLDRPVVVRAEGVVRRLGAPVVTLAFLTVGLQTAVNAAAGSLRMPMSRYLPATVVGSLAWAALYTTVGFAVARAWLDGLGWTWAVGGLVAVALLAMASLALGSRLRRGAAPTV